MTTERRFPAKEEQYPELARAVQYLAGVCDGAATRDGQGFNGRDSPFGKKLAVEYSWSPKQAAVLHTMVQKYKNQLLGAIGIDPATIPPVVIPERVPPQPGAYTRPSHAGELFFHNTLGFSFKFPYNEELKDSIKNNFRYRKWDGVERVWSVGNSLEAGEAAVMFAAHHNFLVNDNVQAAIDRLRGFTQNRIEASTAANAEYEVEGLGGTLRPFQKAGVKYLVETVLGGRNGSICGDVMGLGKTIIAIATLKKLEAFPAIVVCPASLKLNWEREIHKWLPSKNVVVVDSKTVDFTADVLVINYDILPKHLEALKTIRPEIVVLDESHYIKNRKAKRTEAAKELLAAGKHKGLLLSGTSIMNRPSEFITQLDGINVLRPVFGGFWPFVNRYCQAAHTGYGMDLSGAANIDELNQKLRATCYIRREKEDVLKELPPKQRSLIMLQLDNLREYKRAEKDLVQWLWQNEGHSAAMKAQNAEQLVRIEKLKQLAVKGKMEGAAEWVENFMESCDRKLVLFAVHKDVVRELRERFATYNPAILTGETSMQDRQEAVDRFQNNPNCRLFISNLTAGGVGITLTAASDVAFLEFGWNPAAHDQAEDRVHRIGQTHHSVNAWYLVGDQSIDVDILELIEAKRKVVMKALVGGDVDEEDGIMSQLMARLERRN